MLIIGWAGALFASVNNITIPSSLVHQLTISQLVAVPTTSLSSRSTPTDRLRWKPTARRDRWFRIWKPQRATEALPAPIAPAPQAKKQAVTLLLRDMRPRPRASELERRANTKVQLYTEVRREIDSPKPTTLKSVCEEKARYWSCV